MTLKKVLGKIHYFLIFCIMAENPQTLERALEGNGVMQKILRFVTRTKTGMALLFGTLLVTVSCGGGEDKSGSASAERSYSLTCADDPNFPLHYDLDAIFPNTLPKDLLPYTLNTKEVAAEGQANLPSGKYRVVVWKLMNSKTAKAYWQHPEGEDEVEKMSYARFRDSDSGIENDSNRLESCSLSSVAPANIPQSSDSQD